VVTEDAKRVLQGYFKLLNFERSEVDNEIERHRKASLDDQMIIEGRYSKGRVVSGPTSTNCPCCGR